MKQPYGSAEWVVIAGEVITAMCKDVDLANVNFTFSEVLTGAPQALDPDSEGRLGWYIKVRSGSIDVGPGIPEEADFKVTMDYATVSPYTSIVVGDSAEIAGQLAEKMKQAYREGKYVMEGNRAALKAMPWAGRLHDALAPLTV